MLYHLAADGKDTNDGKTRATAWATFTFAKTKLVVGDVLNVYDAITIPPQPDMITVITIPPTLPPPPPPGTKTCIASPTGIHVQSTKVFVGKTKSANICLHCGDVYFVP
jgi:hypothetical protein